MPVYQYEGQHYDLPEGLSNEDAISKIEAHLGKTKDTEGVMSKVGSSLLGGAEAVGQLASSIPAMVAGPLKGLQAATRGASTQEADKIAGDQMQAMTYEPRTEKGQEYSAAIGEVMNRYIVPVAPMLHTMPALKVREGVNAGRAAFSKNEIPSVSKAAAMEAEIMATKEAATPPVAPEAPIVDTRPSMEKSKAAYEQALREKELQRQSAFHRPEQLGNLGLESPMERMTRDLGAEPGKLEQPTATDTFNPLSEHTPMERMAFDLENPNRAVIEGATKETQARQAETLAAEKQRAAQELIDKRKLEEQQAINQKTSLEQGAAERSRQEQAPVYSKEHLAEVERLKRVSEAELAQHQDNLATLQRQLDESKARAETQEQQVRIQEAEKALALRQTALEFEVKRRASLDFGAAERARQLGAGPSVAVQVDNHPFVKAAEHKVALQEQMITKIQMAQEAGHANGVQLARAIRDLKGLEDKVTTVRANVGDSLSKGVSPKSRPSSTSTRLIGGRQGSFNKRTKYQGGGQGYSSMLVDAVVKAKDLYLNSRQSKAMDAIKKNKSLEAMLPEHTTVAATPEEVALLAARAPDVDIGATVHLKEKNGVFSESTPSAIARHLRMSKKAVERQFTKGFLYEKSKTNNPIIKYTYDKVSTAVDAARNITHNLLQKDLLPKLRELTNKEMIELHEAMQSAVSNKYELSRDMMEKHGFNEKQIATWESFQNSFDTSFNNINNALKEAGKEPITKYTAYMAGMATGDFRTPIFKKMSDGTPSIVGFVGSNVAWMRDTRVKNFLKEHPEYFAGEGTFHGKGYDRVGSGDALVQALQLLSDSSPDIAVFSQELAAHMKSDAYGYKGANKHTMDKKGVFGMEGSKQWVTGWKSLLPLSDDMKQAAISKQNALDGFRAQVRYIESMAKWSELSKATSDLAKVISDPALQESQKNAIAMSKEYIKNALGDNPSLVGNKMEALAAAIGKSVGVGPSVFNGMIHGVKGGLNTVFFALNPMFIGANFVQGAMTTPTMVNFLHGRGFDVARFDKLGMSDYMKASTDGLKQIHNPNADAFTIAMWKYGEEHGISTTQIFEHSTDIRQGLQHAANTTLEAGMGAAEGVPRSTMFAMFSNILKDNGFANHPDIFKVARELTDTAMHDYRAHEGQRINRALGPLAPILGNLSTFSAGANSVIAKMVGEAKTGKGAAMAAMVITGLVFHGIMGGSGFAEADKIVEKLSAALGHPTTLSNEILKQAGEHPVMGDLLATGLGSTLGLDTHQQLGRSSIMPTVMGGGSMGAAWDMASAGWVAATKPSEMNAKRFAYQVSPKMLKGVEEVEWFSQGDMAMNKKEGHSTEGLYERNEFDKKARMLGSTSMREFKLKEQVRQQALEDMHLKDKQTAILNKLQDKRVTSQGLQDNDVSEALDKFIEVEGDPKKFAEELKKYEVEISIPVMTRYLMNKANSGSVSAARAIQRLQEKSYGMQE